MLRARREGAGAAAAAIGTTVAKAVYIVLCRRSPRLAGALARLLRLDLPGPVAQDRVRYSWDSYSRSLRRMILDAPALPWLSQLQVPVRLVAAGDDGAVDAALLHQMASGVPR